MDENQEIVNVYKYDECLLINVNSGIKTSFPFVLYTYIHNRRLSAHICAESRLSLSLR